MKKSDKSGVDRRKFLKGAAVGGVASLVAGTGTMRAQRSSGGRADSAPRCRHGRRILQPASKF